VLTPRVFSPRGNFAAGEVTIGFTLGRPASATVRVYDRSGRLVRELANGATYGAGANLVRWDGRDVAGAVAMDGIYLVSIEALGQKETRTLAVVR
jgi:flagellar hook assembly protein FlgD